MSLPEGEIAGDMGENLEGTKSATEEEEVGPSVVDVIKYMDDNNDKGAKRGISDYRRSSVPVATTEVQDTAISQSDDIGMDSKQKRYAETLEVPMTQRFLHLKNDELSHADTESESIVDASLMSGSDSQSPSLRPTKMKKKVRKLKTMKFKRDGRDSDSSVSSKRRGSSRRALVKCKFTPEGLAYIESCLRGRIFSGWVEERKWVENLGSYRDIVEVDEWEVDFNKQLNIIIRKIPGVQEGTRWINITGKYSYFHYSLIYFSCYFFKKMKYV